MYKRCFFVFLFFILGLSVEAAAQGDNRLNSQTLISQAKILDGQAVVFVGEAVGDLMPRKNLAWVHLQDSYGTISVLAPLELVKAIEHWGDYKMRGDMIEVSGVFYRSAPHLGGELFIEGRNFKVLSKGSRIAHEVSDVKVRLIEVLLVIAALLAVLRIVIKRRSQED
jgi:lysyl-tRNA synthetase class II